MMKKRIIILFAISAALLTSCTLDEFYEEMGLTGTTTVTFTPSFGTGDGNAATKAFADVSQLENLYLAVFNEGGKSLVEYVKANPVILATENTTKYAYTATLKTSSKPRVIHFIANAPETIGSGSDVDALGSLNYSFDMESWTGQDAYWGYLKLDNGICDKSDPGFGSLQDALSDVKLVRNFAKINVEMANSNFEITHFWISNFPDCSTAAPYNREARRFETAYGTYTRVTAAMAAGYMGFRPASSGLVSLSGFDDDKLSAIRLDPGASAYTYEREKPTSDPLCIIVGIKPVVSGTESFYKIEIRDNDGNYLPILRNFTYTVTIGNVHKVGMPSVEDALNSVASGAIDIDISLQGLKDLSNGKSRIAVSETERVLFDDKPFDLLYSFIPDVNTGAVVNTTLEQLGKTKEQAETDHDSYVTIEFEAGLAGNVIQTHSVSSTDEIDGYRMVSMTPVPLSGVVKKEVVTVTGHVYNENTGKYETIQRTVNYQIRPHLDMTLTLTPDVIPEEYTETITAIIGIEENLPKSLFTLDMMITSEQMTLSPGDDKLSISTGVGADGKPAFLMSRAITWEEYSSTASVLDADGIKRKHFDCLLKVNTSDFEDLDESFGKGDRVLVTNGAFNTGSALLCVGSDGLKRFITPHLDKEYLVSGKTAAICFGMTALPADGTITVMMPGMEPVNPATGSGFSGISKVSEGNYELTVTGTTVKLDVTPTTPAAASAKFWLEDDEFWPSAEFQYDIQAPAFSDLKFNFNDLDYVVAGRTAMACFHMEYLPADGKVTLHLKNAEPTNATIAASGTSEANGYKAYEIYVTSEDINFPVVISPAVGETDAFFKLTAANFIDSDVAEAPVRKPGFSNLKLINVNNPGKKCVIGGRPARIDFTLDDLPSDNVITIELVNLTLGTGRTGVSTIVGKGSGKYDLTVTGKHVILDVTPAAGATTASYTLTDGEFIDGGCTCTVPVGMLHFQNYRVANVSSEDFDLDYLVAGNTARIYISLEEIPSDKTITIELENLTFVTGRAGVSAVVDKGSGEHELTVTGKNVLLDVTPAAGATTASYKLTAEEFEEITVEKNILTRFTIDWRNVHFVDEDGNPITDTWFCFVDEDYNEQFIFNGDCWLYSDEDGNIRDTNEEILEIITMDISDADYYVDDFDTLTSDPLSLSSIAADSRTTSGATIVIKQSYTRSAMHAGRRHKK